jgi:hypothetical protein
MNLKLLFSITMLGIAEVSIANPVTREKAAVTASTYLKTGTTPMLVKSAQRVKARPNAIAAENAPLYIFSRGSGQGFVIVSGDDCLPEVLGYTDSGDYDETKLPPALLDMISGYAKLIEDAQAQNAPARAQRKAPSSWTDISPLIKTHWHQTSPYNNLCPYLKGTTTRSVTGCVATAAAQVIYYYYKDNPTTLLAQTPTYDYGDAPVTESFAKGTPIKWELMQKSYSGTYPLEMTKSVATLMAVTGAATWLSYGKSTSGQIANLISTFATYFNLSSICWYKQGNTQSYWEQLVYEDLAAGHPIVYSGVNSNNEGHAIVLDGYSKSSGHFHFNFGWGGQGDGYYTIDDSTGVNGFKSYQGMTFRVHPLKQNLSAKISKPAQYFYRETTDISTLVTNNGTLPFSGISLYSSRQPITKVSSASLVSSDKTTILAAGESSTITLKHKPMLSGTYYYCVADADGNILDTMSCTTSMAKTDLHFKSISVSAADSRETIEGNSYGTVYNTKATVTVNVYNASLADPYEGMPHCELYESVDGGKTFFEKRYALYSVNIPSGQEKPLLFTFNSLKQDTLYYAKLVTPFTTNYTTDNVTYENADSIVYFKVKGQDLSLASTTGNCAKLSGSWNEDIFKDIAAKNPAVNSYDLTEVSEVSAIPAVANPNTLFYVSANSNASGDNVIKDGHCANLSLTYGYDFEPKSDFTAEKATMLHKQTAAAWSGVILPFDCKVPTGIWTRRVDQLKAGYLFTCTDVQTMQACTPYIFIPSSDNVDRFTAENVTITVKAPSTATDSIQGCFVGKAATSANYVVNPKTNYFEKADTTSVLPAFSVFLNYTNRVRMSSHDYLSADIAFGKMAVKIEEAYATLSAYSSYVSETAKSVFLDSIAKTEDIFTKHKLIAGSPVAQCTSYLAAAIDSFKAGANIPYTVGMDVTSHIVNPSFENFKTGWNTDANSSIHTTTEFAYYGVGSDGYRLLYNKSTSDSTSTSISQTVKGLVSGYYRLSAMVGTVEGHKVTLFAGDKENSIDGHPFGFFYLTEGTVDSVLVTQDSIKIGVKGSDNPYKVDNFKLTFLGEYKDPTSITTVPIQHGNVVVSGSHGAIVVNAEKPDFIGVYALSGQLISRRHIQAGQTTISNLKPGIYIVNRKKIIVM